VIVPRLRAGENVLVSAHGNSLRSIVMHLDRLTPAQVLELNLATGVPIVYEVEPDMVIRSKRILND
jgi:2,3-bisphosphoglycerate-dependent phosphoglycerate mutase